MTVTFFLLGAITATWAARVPAVVAALHLSPGSLGLALLGPAAGAIVAMPATGAALVSVAPRRIVQAGFVVAAGLLPVISLTTSTWQLFAVLAGWGVGLGMIDVGINTQATEVQNRHGRRIMSRFHAAYSVGGLTGAGLGAAAAASGISVRVHFVIAASIVLLGGLLAAEYYAESPALRVKVRAPRSRRPQWSWTLVALAAMALGSFLAEGAAVDWSAVYLHSSLRAPVGLAALTYTVYAAAMALVRLAGDRLSDRLGPVRLIRVSASLAACSFAAALIVGRVWAGLLGFAALGAGLAFIVPLVFTASSQLGRPGPNLAFVTSCGYAGMLAGPGLIGGLAEAIGLPEALGVIVVCSTVAAVLAVFFVPRTPTPAGPEAERLGAGVE
jgi:MFS family permease